MSIGICEICGNLIEDCDCDCDCRKDEDCNDEIRCDNNDNECVWGYDGDCL